MRAVWRLSPAPTWATSSGEETKLLTLVTTQIWATSNQSKFSCYICYLEKILFCIYSREYLISKYWDTILNSCIVKLRLTQALSDSLRLLLVTLTLRPEPGANIKFGLPLTTTPPPTKLFLGFKWRQSITVWLLTMSNWSWHSRWHSGRHSGSLSGSLSASLRLLLWLNSLELDS
mgnify:FL=1